jgi:hypothetical protein
LDFFSRAVDVNEKTYGEASDKVAGSLKFMGVVYFVKKDCAKAEPYLLRAVHIDEALFGKDGIDMNPPLSFLCQLYEVWDKPEKLEACDRQLLAVVEKQFGPDSPVLLATLASESKALRGLGRSEEAAKVEQHMKSIREATGQTEGVALAPHQ